EAELKDILQSDPKSVEANLMLAAVELSRGDIGQAIALYRYVLKINPKSFSAHYGLGMTYLRAHQVDAGLAELRSAATLNQASRTLPTTLASLFWMSASREKL